MAKRPLILDTGVLSELPVAEKMQAGAVFEMVTTTEPASPPAGSIYVWAQSDGHMYTKNSDGLVRQITIPVGDTPPADPEVGFLRVNTS